MQGADYVDGRFSEPPADGLESNLGRMPVLQTDDGAVGQSTAIAYYVAAENGFLGSNHLEAAQILAVNEHIKEMVGEYRKLVPWGTDPADKLDIWFDQGANDVTGPAVRANMATRYATWWMGRIEAMLGDKGFAVGDKLSWADVSIYFIFGETLSDDQAAENVQYHQKAPFGSKERTDAALEKYPKLLASVNAVRNNANHQKWLEIRGKQGF